IALARAKLLEQLADAGIGAIISSNTATRLREFLIAARPSVPRQINHSWDPLSLELSWVPMTRKEEIDDKAWQMFRNRAHRAADAAGFGPNLAGGLAGALGEMASNALEHSFAPGTA